VLAEIVTEPDSEPSRTRYHLPIRDVPVSAALVPVPPVASVIAVQPAGVVPHVAVDGFTCAVMTARRPAATAV
jgi:hypothetical protein